MNKYDYGNILFTGEQCNLGCYGCIGSYKQLQGLQKNLDSFPPKNIDELIEIVNQYNIPDLAFTGTNVDPQMYKHEKDLIEYCRENLTSDTKLSLHTNGILAVEKMDLFNSYDKASVSLHSYNPETYLKMTRTGKMPDIEKIVEQSKVPLKLSMLITKVNMYEIPDYIDKSAELGIKRIVVRKLKNREHEFPLEKIQPFADKEPVKHIFGWPVYDIQGIETTICDFTICTAKGIFLFSDGRLEERLVKDE